MDISEEVKKVQQELGRQGGLTTKKKYGAKHYQKLAENMNYVRRMKGLMKKEEKELTLEERIELRRYLDKK